MSHTAEFLGQDEAEHGFKKNADAIDFEEIDAAILVVVEDGVVSLNSVGNAELVVSALQQALEQLQQVFGPSMN